MMRLHAVEQVRKCKKQFQFHLRQSTLGTNTHDDTRKSLGKSG